MNANNLNRDGLWTPDVWKDIDTAVLAEVGAIRIAQKVFPSTPMPGAANVPADIFRPQSMSISEGQTKAFIEISIEFQLTQSQVDNEITLHTARTLAKLSAKSIALAEDSLIHQGEDAKLPPTVKVVNRESANSGLLGAARANKPIEVKHLPNKPGVYGEDTFRAVTKGMADLGKEGQPGPYALVLESTIYADTYAPLPTTLVTTADRLTPLLPGGFYGTGTLPESTGLLVSLGGEPTSIFVGVDAITAYTQEDLEGRHRFRVFERVQFVARDPRAFIRLEFK
jgi:uncharacterized linocin/CFP29 family protein